MNQNLITFTSECNIRMPDDIEDCWSFFSVGLLHSSLTLKRRIRPISSNVSWGRFLTVLIVLAQQKSFMRGISFSLIESHLRKQILMLLSLQVTCKFKDSASSINCLIRLNCSTVGPVLLISYPFLLRLLIVLVLLRLL